MPGCEGLACGGVRKASGAILHNVLIGQLGFLRCGTCGCTIRAHYVNIALGGFCGRVFCPCAGEKLFVLRHEKTKCFWRVRSKNHYIKTTDGNGARCDGRQQKEAPIFLRGDLLLCDGGVGGKDGLFFFSIEKKTT